MQNIALLMTEMATVVMAIATIAMAVATFFMASYSRGLNKIEGNRRDEETPKLNYLVISEQQRAKPISVIKEIKLILWNTSKTTVSIFDHEVLYKDKILRTTPQSYQFSKYDKQVFREKDLASVEISVETKGDAHLPIVINPGSGVGLYFVGSVKY